MNAYIHPAPEAGKQFYQRFKSMDKVVMINLLKFREVANYTHLDAIKPSEPFSGREAYKLYSEHIFPVLERMGSKLLYYGTVSEFLIGPESETWDAVHLVEHESAEKFIAFAQDEEYLQGAGHRTAALADSRLLPSTSI